MHFWPVFLPFANKLAMPFLVFFASLPFPTLVQTQPCFAQLQKQIFSEIGFFPSNTEVIKASVFCILTIKKGRGGLRKSSPQKIRGSQKHAKMVLFQIEKFFFPPTLLLCYCGSVKSRKFIESDRFQYNYLS